MPKLQIWTQTGDEPFASLDIPSISEEDMKSLLKFIYVKIIDNMELDEMTVDYRYDIESENNVFGDYPF